jgi:hypothetical protein
MTVTESARHHLVSSLEESLGQEAAMTLAELLPPSGWSDVATRHDLDVLRRELAGEIGSLRKDTTAELVAVRKEMSAEFASVRKDVESLRQDMTAELVAVRKEMSAEFVAVQKDVTIEIQGATMVLVKVMVVGGLTLLIAFIGLFVTVFQALQAP